MQLYFTYVFPCIRNVKCAEHARCDSSQLHVALRCVIRHILFASHNRKQRVRSAKHHTELRSSKSFDIDLDFVRLATCEIAKMSEREKRVRSLQRKQKYKEILDRGASAVEESEGRSLAENLNIIEAMLTDSNKLIEEGNVDDRIGHTTEVLMDVQV